MVLPQKHLAVFFTGDLLLKFLVLLSDYFPVPWRFLPLAEITKIRNRLYGVVFHHYSFGLNVYAPVSRMNKESPFL
jgi:hypothetical protein